MAASCRLSTFKVLVVWCLATKIANSLDRDQARSLDFFNK